MFLFSSLLKVFVSLAFASGQNRVLRTKCEFPSLSSVMLHQWLEICFINWEYSHQGLWKILEIMFFIFDTLWLGHHLLELKNLKEPRLSLQAPPGPFPVTSPLRSLTCSADLPHRVHLLQLLLIFSSPFILQASWFFCRPELGPDMGLVLHSWNNGLVNQWEWLTISLCLFHLWDEHPPPSPPNEQNSKREITPPSFSLRSSLMAEVMFYKHVYSLMLKCLLRNSWKWSLSKAKNYF